MICPYCKETMEAGYVQTPGRSFGLVEEDCFSTSVQKMIRSLLEE